MNNRLKIMLVARSNSIGGRFQAKLTPNSTLSGKELVERWAEYSHMNPAMAQATLTMLEGFILAELSKGNRLDFNLATFYPRLSGALPSRDSSPEAEGLFVRGTVKARRPLMNALNDKLEAVNNLSSIHSHIFSVLDKTLNRLDEIGAGHVLSIAGCGIPVDAAKEDEGVWLERRTHKGYVRVAQGRVVREEADFTEVVFDGPIEPGKYVLAVYTRCGNGGDYRVVRISHKVRVV